jgi:tripartite-type tricarboxylate transporter receptor subunit TctC
MRRRPYALGLCLSLWLVSETFAQDWPDRAVKVIAPVGPGGYTDVMARLTAERLARTFGVPFVVENRGGGGGVIGTEYAVRARPDGYTLWFGGGAQFSSAPLVKKLPYDPITGLTPISMVTINGLGLAISPKLPANDIAEFVAYAKSRPGEVNYGTSGTGQSSHLAAALWMSREKLDLVMVPYPTVPAVMVGLMTGDVQMYFGNMIDVVEQARARKVKLLAVTGAKRLAQFPDTPTLSEQLPNFVFTSWVGYFAPAGAPRHVIDKLSKALSDVCRQNDVAELVADMGAECVGSTPADLAATIQADLPIAKAAVEAAGLAAN